MLKYWVELEEEKFSCCNWHLVVSRTSLVVRNQEFTQVGPTPSVMISNPPPTHQPATVLTVLMDCALSKAPLTYLYLPHYLPTFHNCVYSLPPSLPASG